MTDSVKKGLIVLGIFVVGLAVGRFSLPAKVVEKEHIVYQEKIVEKKVDVTAIKKKDNKTYVRIEKTSPDGTKTVETRIVDTGTTDTTDTDKDQTDTAVSKTDDKSKVTTYDKNGFLLSVGADNSFNRNPLMPSWGVLINKRLIGPFYLGGFVFTDGVYGLNVGLGF